MYSKLVANIRIRSEDNQFLYEIFSELSVICERIVIDDRENLLSREEMKMLSTLFDADIYKSEAYDLNMYNPDWIITLYDDEVTSKNFRFMKDSFCLNPYVNIWEADVLTLWDDEEQHRTDKLWGTQKYPFMYRFVPEIDYEYKDGCLVPTNQPGPQEYCSEPVLSYRYVNRDARIDIYKDYLKDKEKLNYVTQLHYESLLDENVVLKTW